MEAASQTDQHNWEAVETRTEENYQTLGEHNVAISDPVPDELLTPLKEAASGVVESWLEKTGDDGESILSEFRGAE